MKIVHFAPGEYQLRSMNMKIVQNEDLKELSLGRFEELSMVISQWSVGRDMKNVIGQ